MSVLHGGYGTKLYGRYHAIKKRCNNPNASDYARYGGRGIKMCPEWENSFEAFRDWAISAGWTDECVLTIDRFPDNDGNYEPSNCRLVGIEIQNRNKKDGRGESKYIGVSLWKKWGYVASLARDGERHIIGCYDDEENAAMARDMYIIKYKLRDEYPLNFPDRDYSRIILKPKVGKVKNIFRRDVSMQSHNGKFYCRFRYEKKTFHVGTFDNLHTARTARISFILNMIPNAKIV